MDENQCKHELWRKLKNQTGETIYKCDGCGEQVSTEEEVKKLGGKTIAATGVMGKLSEE